MNNAPQEILKELSGREAILWSGQPRQGVVLRASDAFMIPFSLLWCGFAIFWESSVLSAPKAPGFFAVWGVPFVAMGIYMVIGRFFVEARQRASTYYAVTPERVLIVSGIFSRAVKSLNLRTLTDISLSEAGSGEGTITFGPQSPFASPFGMTSWPGASQQAGPKFDLIAGAKSVYDTIRNAQRAAT
jgi:hypothetical protein